MGFIQLQVGNIQKMAKRCCTKCHRAIQGKVGKYGTSFTHIPLIMDPATEKYVEPPYYIDIANISAGTENSQRTENFHTPTASMNEKFQFLTNTTQSLEGSL